MYFFPGRVQDVDLLRRGDVRPRHEPDHPEETQQQEQRPHQRGQQQRRRQQQVQEQEARVRGHARPMPGHQQHRLRTPVHQAVRHRAWIGGHFSETGGSKWQSENLKIN